MKMIGILNSNGQRTEIEKYSEGCMPGVELGGKTGPGYN